MWRDIRNFPNQFPLWQDISKPLKNDEKKQENENKSFVPGAMYKVSNESKPELDDLMTIASLLPNKSLQNMLDYALKNITRIFNLYSIKHLNEMQQLHLSSPNEHQSVDGTIYVGIHGISILYLRIIKLIDENHLNDHAMEQTILLQNEAKDMKYKNKVTPNGSNSDEKKTEMEGNNKNNNSEKSEKSDPIFIYKNSKDLLYKFIHDLCISLHCKNIAGLRRKLLTRIVEFVEFILSDQNNDTRNHWDKVVTLILGKAGIISIAIVVFYMTSNHTLFSKYVHLLINISDRVLRTRAYELLYGQIGYISCIQFIQSYIDNPCYNQKNKNELKNMDISDLLGNEKVVAIMDNIMNEGKQYLELNAKNKNFYNAPLMWEFHGTCYLSSAHGYVGIVNALLQMRYALIEKYEFEIAQSMMFLSAIKYKNTGNYPQSLKTVNNVRSDYLVQWCHGSPSYVTLFARSYAHFGVPKENMEINDDDDHKNDNSNKYKNVSAMSAKDMMDGCEHIWENGLLTKGRSLCHGIAGNAYSFLMVYAVLNKYPLQSGIDIRKFLYFAYQFAVFMTSPNATFMHEPDAPDSLFEGVSGECCFLMDLLFNYKNPKFPCYDF